MDFGLTEEQQAWKDSVWQFCEGEIQPARLTYESDLIARRELHVKMAAFGLMTQTIPKEYGGHFQDTISYLLALTTIAKADAGVAVAMSVTNLVTEAILLFGNEAQRKRYLPKFASGKWAGACFALTEEHAGSDPKGLECSAELDATGQFYLLNGHKRWITNGNLADMCLVFAKIPSGEITAFLVEKGTKGWNVPTLVDKLGLLTVSLTTMEFCNCQIAAEQMLGELGGGLSIALAMLDRGRIGIAAQAIGIAEAALEASIHHAQKREQFGKPIGKNQAIAFKLADMHMKLEAARLLVYKAAWLRDKSESFTQAASVAKLFASEAANEIVDAAVQIHGGYGYIKEYPIERYFRDVRATTIYEGTSEIQRLVISRALLQFG